MPVKIKKRGSWTHAKCTTMEKVKSQERLLHGIKQWKPTGKSTTEAAEQLVTRLLED